MSIIRGILLSVLVILPVMAFSQKKEITNEKPVYYSVTVGSGWTHYFNNLEYGDQNISTDFAGISFRFLWEPEYRLSVGFESGFYRLFKVKDQLNGKTVEADRGVLPLMLLARMRIAGNFYLGTGFGVALITNKTKADGDKINTLTWSLSNYLASAAYIYPLNDHLHLGGEMKIYNYGGLNDWMYSLQVICSFRF